MAQRWAYDSNELQIGDLLGFLGLGYKCQDVNTGLLVTSSTTQGKIMFKNKASTVKSRAKRMNPNDTAFAPGSSHA